MCQPYATNYDNFIHKSCFKELSIKQLISKYKNEHTGSIKLSYALLLYIKSGHLPKYSYYVAYTLYTYELSDTINVFMWLINSYNGGYLKSLYMLPYFNIKYAEEALQKLPESYKKNNIRKLCTIHLIKENKNHELIINLCTDILQYSELDYANMMLKFTIMNKDYNKFMYIYNKYKNLFTHISTHIFLCRAFIYFKSYKLALKHLILSDIYNYSTLGFILNKLLLNTQQIFIYDYIYASIQYGVYHLLISLKNPDRSDIRKIFRMYADELCPEYDDAVNEFHINFNNIKNIPIWKFELICKYGTFKKNELIQQLYMLLN